MNANTIQLVIIASTAASLLLGLICIFVSKIARTESKRTAALVVSFEDEIKGASKDLDTLSARMASQARRIAWLETRVRNHPIDTQTVLAPEPKQLAKDSITERRHRVLMLSKTGLDAASISSTLGVPKGEVDLIIGLSKAAAA